MGLFVLNECIILAMYNARAWADLSVSSPPHWAGKRLPSYSSLVLIAKTASSFPFFGPSRAFWQSMMNSLPFGAGAFCILTQGGSKSMAAFRNCWRWSQKASWTEEQRVCCHSLHNPVPPVLKLYRHQRVDEFCSYWYVQRVPQAKLLFGWMFGGCLWSVIAASLN